MANPVRYDEYFKYHLSCGFELSIPGGFSDGYKIPKHIDYYGDVNPVFVLSDRYEELVIVGLKPVSPPNALSNRVKTALFSHKDADPVFVEDIDFAYDEFSSDLSPIRLISMFFGGVPFDYPSPKNFTVDQISSKNPLSKVRNEWANGKASVSRSGKNVYVYGEDFEYTIKTATAKSGWATYGSEGTLIFAESHDSNITLIGSVNDPDRNGYAQVHGLMMLLEPDAFFKREG